MSIVFASRQQLGPLHVQCFFHITARDRAQQLTLEAGQSVTSGPTNRDELDPVLRCRRQLQNLDVLLGNTSLIAI